MHKAGTAASTMAAGPATLANGGVGHEEMREGNESEGMVKAYEQQQRQSYDADMRPLDEEDFVLADEEEEDDDFK